MAEQVPASTEIDPTFNKSSSNAYTPRPLNPNSFTGMVNNVPSPPPFSQPPHPPLLTPLIQSPEAVKSRYTSQLSTYGSTNTTGGSLFRDRLAADVELAKNPNSGYNAWNEKRKQAIERGEDPNSEFLAMVEERRPDSLIERGWRKLTGKGKTRKEEIEKKKQKELEKERKREGKERSGEDDGVIR